VIEGAYRQEAWHDTRARYSFVASWLFTWGVVIYFQYPPCPIRLTPGHDQIANRLLNDLHHFCRDARSYNFLHTGIRQVLDQRNVDRKGEAKVTHPSTREMLYTYLGKRTGERVLTGAVKRGDGEKIYAVIWFCDLRDSTSLAESMPVEAFLDLLNQFFDCTAGAVLDHGGEILRFIGDASLAIFPIGGSSRSLREICTPAEGACERALAAARDASSRIDDLNRNRRNRGEHPLGFALAIHIGEVMYGNIGVPGRLEFTVIGSAANEAARLAALCRELDQSVLISWEFPRCYPEQTKSLGVHRLRGVGMPREIFRLVEAG
jgi:adenylate cyclase